MNLNWNWKEIVLHPKIIYALYSIYKSIYSKHKDKSLIYKN